LFPLFPRERVRLGFGDEFVVAAFDAYVVFAETFNPRSLGFPKVLAGFGAGGLDVGPDDLLLYLPPLSRGYVGAL
jgi:hypothetical protein